MDINPSSLWLLGSLIVLLLVMGISKAVKTSQAKAKERSQAKAREDKEVLAALRRAQQKAREKEKADALRLKACMEKYLYVYGAEEAGPKAPLQLLLSGQAGTFSVMVHRVKSTNDFNAPWLLARPQASVSEASETVSEDIADTAQCEVQSDLKAATPDTSREAVTQFTPERITLSLTPPSRIASLLGNLPLEALEVVWIKATTTRYPEAQLFSETGSVQLKPQEASELYTYLRLESERHHSSQSPTVICL